MIREDQLPTIRTKQNVMSDADFDAWHERWKKSTAKKAARRDETTIDEANAQDLATFDATEAAVINAERRA